MLRPTRHIICILDFLLEMKAVKDFRNDDNFGAEDEHRGTKLHPAKKSGKERYNLYGSLEEDDGFDEPITPRESVFDYFDDEEDDL